LSPAQLTNDGHHPLQGKFKDKTGTRTSDRKATEVPLLVEAWTKLLARWISIAIPPEGEREVMEEGEQRLMQSAAQRATLDARLSKCKPRAPLRLKPRCIVKPNLNKGNLNNGGGDALTITGLVTTETQIINKRTEDLPSKLCYHALWFLPPVPISKLGGWKFQMENTQGKLKPGWLSQHQNDTLRIILPSANERQFISLGFLHSYEHMGTARLSCERCHCEERSVSTLWDQRVSFTVDTNPLLVVKPRAGRWRGLKEGVSHSPSSEGPGLDKQSKYRPQSGTAAGLGGGLILSVIQTFEPVDRKYRSRLRGDTVRERGDECVLRVSNSDGGKLRLDSLVVTDTVTVTEATVTGARQELQWLVGSAQPLPVVQPSIGPAAFRSRH